MRIVVRSALRRRDVHQPQHLDGAVHRIAAVQALVHPDGLGDLVADGIDRVQRGHRLLEDDGDLLAADLSHLVRAERDEVAALPHDLAVDNLARRHLDQLQHRHRGDGLAAAGLADHAQRLAAVDGEVDAIDRPHHAVIGL